MHIKIARQWKSTLTGVTHVLILNFKTFRFAYLGRSNVAAKIFLLYLHFSLSLSQFQPIFVSFVTISAFLWRCFKAMLLVRIVPSQSPEIRSCILLMMDIIKPGSHLPLPYLWHSCWYCLGYCSDKKKTLITGNIGQPNLYHKCVCKVYWTANIGGTCSHLSKQYCRYFITMYIISNTNNIIFSKMLFKCFYIFLLSAGKQM